MHGAHVQAFLEVSVAVYNKKLMWVEIAVMDKIPMYTLTNTDGRGGHVSGLKCWIITFVPIDFKLWRWISKVNPIQIVTSDWNYNVWASELWYGDPAMF